MNKSFLALALTVLSACEAPETVPLQPRLAFTIGAESGLTAARDLTVDTAGNVIVFDYDDYVIQTFDPSGGAIGTFGGPEPEHGGFLHLMAVRALGDSLLALDAGSLSVFELSGELRRRQPLADTIVCDLPRVHPSGQWAGEWIVEQTAEKTLTHRDSEGRERSRVAGYGLDEFFPGIEPGGMFFIRPTEARSYLYDFFPDGRLVWAISDELRVNVRDGGEDELLFSADWTPLPFPPEEAQALREAQAGLSPPLFLNVPENYQRIQHLVVDETGTIWIYVVSLDRTGFLHLSARGREIGFHTVEADFDVLSARVTAAEGHLYFLLGGSEETRIYTVDRP